MVPLNKFSQIKFFIFFLAVNSFSYGGSVHLLTVNNNGDTSNVWGRLSLGVDLPLEHFPNFKPIYFNPIIGYRLEIKKNYYFEYFTVFNSIQNEHVIHTNQPPGSNYEIIRLFDYYTHYFYVNFPGNFHNKYLSNSFNVGYGYRPVWLYKDPLSKAQPDLSSKRNFIATVISWNIYDLFRTHIRIDCQYDRYPFLFYNWTQINNGIEISLGLDFFFKYSE